MPTSTLGVGIRWSAISAGCALTKWKAAFYQNYAELTDEYCQVPQLIASIECGDGILLVIEDLDALGFSLRKGQSDWPSLKLAIRWLAYFHAKFMGNQAKGLWPVGSYWHLATRQDEWKKMPEGDFKVHAQAVDCLLSEAKFQTLVHGDAKFANLCFHPNGKQLAAVDFQYVGRGSGVKDLAYLVGSCLDQSGLVKYGGLSLEENIRQLNLALHFYKNSIDKYQLEAENRRLYPIAWSDFYRFLLGWNPQGWKICDYIPKAFEF